jgi:hypothetical protein
LHGHLISDEEIEPKTTEVIPFEQGQDSGMIPLLDIITSDWGKMNRGQNKDVKRLVFRGVIALILLKFCADLLVTGNFDAPERPLALGFPVLQVYQESFSLCRISKLNCSGRFVRIL